MENDINIIFGEPEQIKFQQKNMPFSSSKLFDSKLSSNLKIFITEESLNNAVTHAKSNTSQEIGGVLVGNVYKDGDSTWIEIVGAIAAENTRAGSSHVTFTHDTWSRFSAKMENNYPNLRMVGWYHSHPHFGIFLSGHDRFIHKNFFAELWHIALVIDPINNTLGFFQWKEKELIKTGFFVNNFTGKLQILKANKLNNKDDSINKNQSNKPEPIVITPESIKKEAPENEPIIFKKQRSLFWPVMFVSFILLVAFAFGWHNFSSRMAAIEVSQKDTSNIISNLKNKLAKAENKLNEIGTVKNVGAVKDIYKSQSKSKIVDVISVKNADKTLLYIFESNPSVIKSINMKENSKKTIWPELDSSTATDTTTMMLPKSLTEFGQFIYILDKEGNIYRLEDKKIKKIIINWGEQTQPSDIIKIFSRADELLVFSDLGIFKLNLKSENDDNYNSTAILESSSISKSPNKLIIDSSTNNIYGFDNDNKIFKIDKSNNYQYLNSGSNLDFKLEKPVAIAISDSNIYILDSLKSNLLEYNKDGVYNKTYKNGIFKPIKKILISNSNLIIVSENKISKISNFVK